MGRLIKTPRTLANIRVSAMPNRSYSSSSRLWWTHPAKRWRVKVGDTQLETKRSWREVVVVSRAKRYGSTKTIHHPPPRTISTIYLFLNFPKMTGEVSSNQILGLVNLFMLPCIASLVAMTVWGRLILHSVRLTQSHWGKAWPGCSNRISSLTCTESNPTTCKTTIQSVSAWIPGVAPVVGTKSSKIRKTRSSREGKASLSLSLRNGTAQWKFRSSYLALVGLE